MIKRVRIYSQSPLIRDGTEGAIESVCFKGVEFTENVWLFLTGTKQTVRNNEVSILSGCL